MCCWRSSVVETREDRPTEPQVYFDELSCARVFPIVGFLNSISKHFVLKPARASFLTTGVSFSDDYPSCATPKDSLVLPSSFYWVRLPSSLWVSWNITSFFVDVRTMTQADMSAGFTLGCSWRPWGFHNPNPRNINMLSIWHIWSVYVSKEDLEQPWGFCVLSASPGEQVFWSLDYIWPFRPTFKFLHAW